MNIISYLEDRGIPYASRGKNVSSGWVGVQCPFCEDESSHCGLNVETGTGFNCWRCGAKGHITFYITRLSKCSPKQAQQIFLDYGGGVKESTTHTSVGRSFKTDNLSFNFPSKDLSKTFPSEYVDYLLKRDFNPEQLIRDYDLYAGPNYGPMKFRIVAPCIEGGKPVSYTGLSIIRNKEVPKYKHCPNEKSVIPIKKCLYNIDSVKDICLIVEGITDVWRLGQGAIATFGIEFSIDQVAEIIRKGVLKAVIFFDAEPRAQERAEKLAGYLSHYIHRVENFCLEKAGSDPAELSENEVVEIRREVFYEVK